ncbi:MAG: ATP-binding protein [Spirochaetes bacterium]|nr:ATP-binding protein [Spirochaetota bacterium]
MAKLWQIYVNSGSRHFTSAVDLKRNRILNMLFSMGFMGGIYIALIEAAFAVVLLQRDYTRYIGYVWPFVVATLVYPALVVVTVIVKNITGSFHVTFLNNIFVNLFCLSLALFLGERAKMHLIILSQFPIIFLFYRYGSWKSIALHMLLAFVGIAAILVSYRIMTPLYPLPDDLADIPGYLCWLATFGMLVWYSVYNWRQVHATESLLENERDQVKELLQETIPKLEKAEAKYRHLVDDSGDLIFQMNGDCRILSMNKTSQPMLSFAPDDMIGQNFCEFIAKSGEALPQLGRELLREQVRKLRESGRIVRFKTRLVHKHRSDGIEALISLQLSRAGGSEEILGKAAMIEPEVSLKFLDQEKGRYTLTNDIMHAEILSQRISERIVIHFSSSELNALRTCFREILINAIEHGNLGVTFEEKSRAIEEGDYMQFLLERQLQPEYAARRVRVHYVVNRSALIMRVTDDGDGFDHRAFLERANSDESMLMLEHGRGISMTINAFDAVEFNEKGNEVTLRKVFRNAA